MLGSNYSEQNNNSKIVTENEDNANRLKNILENLNMDVSTEKKGKNYIITWNINNRENIADIDIENEEIQKAIVRGTFMASGSINDPNKKYHLEIIFDNKENAGYIFYIVERFKIECKLIKRKEKYSLYIKDGEEISKFLALIGASKSVMKYEEIRIVREMRNNVNRIVNCETANINKTINVAVSQIADIKYIQEKKKFEELPNNLKEIANLRIENPESSLVELGKMLKSPIGKSGVNHRLKKIQEIANELRDENK